MVEQAKKYVQSRRKNPTLPPHQPGEPEVQTPRRCLYMKVKNIVRKAVALGSGAALVGTTLMGAFAYDLSSYPSKYIVDGKFDGKIVVGERAATADVLGSIDIAASLQGASVTTKPLSTGASTVSLSGDVKQVGAGSDKLELRERVGKVTDTLTSSDLQA